MNENALNEIIEHLEKDLATLHAGRVSPSMLDTVIVMAYNTPTPLNQLATINNQGAQSLVIQPWDASVIKEIEKALRSGTQDYNPVVDGQTLRVNFPPLTEDKRKEVVKIVHQKAEEAHVAIKRSREDEMNQLKNQKQDKEISEDDFFSEQKKIQQSIDTVNSKVKEIALAKEQEIMKI